VNSAHLNAKTLSPPRHEDAKMNINGSKSRSLSMLCIAKIGSEPGTDDGAATRTSEKYPPNASPQNNPLLLVSKKQR
jgi:hypothetical protein